MTNEEYERIQLHLSKKLNEHHSDGYYNGILAAKSILREEYIKQAKRSDNE